MKYELTRADGSICRMTLLVDDVTPESEISKWDAKDRTGPREVVKIERVDEFSLRSAAQMPTSINDADTIAALQATIAIVTDKLRSAQEDMKADNDRLRQDILRWGKGELAKAGVE